MIYLETERNEYVVHDEGDVEFTDSYIVDFDIRNCDDGYSEFCKYVKEMTKHMTDVYEHEWQVVYEGNKTTKEDNRGEYELYYAAIECEDIDNVEYELHGQYRKVK